MNDKSKELYIDFRMNFSVHHKRIYKQIETL